MKNTLATLVPFYIQGPNPRGIFTKKWAVHVIVAGRLNSGHAGYHCRQSQHGKGNKAARRVEALRAKFEAEADAATHEWFNDRLLTEADVDQLAEQHGNRRVNFHE